MDTALLVAAAFVAGALNAVAGGGSFLTLPALVFTGVPPVVANATGTVALLPGYMPMGRDGMAEHQDHVNMGHMKGPENTLPMMTGTGPFGNLEMGGMFTLIKVRDDIAPGDFRDPGWYRNPPGTVAKRVSTDPDFGDPVRAPALPPAAAGG